MISICCICHKPVYSFDRKVSNDDGMVAHSDCFKGLTYNFTMGKIRYPRKNTGKITRFDKAFYILTTMKGEVKNERDLRRYVRRIFGLWHC